MPLLRGVAARLLDPRDRAAALAVAVALCCAEAALCALIIRRVPYTEIDWEARPPRPPSRLAGADARLCLCQAYMQEVAGYAAGERDYTKLRGDTGAPCAAAAATPRR